MRPPSAPRNGLCTPGSLYRGEALTWIIRVNLLMTGDGVVVVILEDTVPRVPDSMEKIQNVLVSGFLGASLLLRSRSLARAPGERLVASAVRNFRVTCTRHQDCW